MIKFYQTKSTTDKLPVVEGFETIDVLNWKKKWKALSPYFMKTDGEEELPNPGGVLFENFWQGSKVFDRVFSIEVYASHFHRNNPKYLWWKYDAAEGGDIMYDSETKEVNYELWTKWRDSIWSCPNAIRYPNGYSNRWRTQFSLGKGDVRLGYIDARKQIYVKEYSRLARKTPEFTTLLNKLRSGKNLLICEVDVPREGKKGSYGLQKDVTLEYLDELMNDGSEAFGHGVCLAKALLEGI